MGQVKTVKYGNITLDATYWYKQGKEAFITRTQKKYHGRPIFANRNPAQQKEWLELMWQAIETEVGVKKSVPVKQDEGKKQ